MLYMYLLVFIGNNSGMGTFDKELLGYDKRQVDKRIEEDTELLVRQKKDIEFLKNHIQSFSVDVEKDL